MKRTIGSARLAQLGSSIFAEIEHWKQMALANGQSLIDLGIGSPDRPPSPRVREALAQAVSNPQNYRYPTSQGTLALRQAIARWFERSFAVSLDAEREVLVLMGTQDGLAHIGLALADQGDRAIIPDPCYPIYAANLLLAGVEPYYLTHHESNAYMPDFSRIPEEVAQQARLMILSYPSNPLAAVAEPHVLDEAVAYCRARNIVLAHDYAYSEMLFAGRAKYSVLQAPGAKDCAVEFHSFSKSFQMAGCRIGFVVGNAEVIAALAKLKANIDYGVFLAVQEAAIVALEEEREQPTVADLYESRSRFFVGELNRFGWLVQQPEATMFVWARLPAGWSSREFARQLLLCTGVVITPGAAFGQAGEGFVRIALVQELDQLTVAAQRIETFWKEYVYAGQ